MGLKIFFHASGLFSPWAKIQGSLSNFFNGAPELKFHARIVSAVSIN